MNLDLLNIETRLINIDHDVRWLDDQDRVGDIHALERLCCDAKHAYHERQRIRTGLMQEYIAKTGDYVRISRNIRFTVTEAA